MNAIHWFEIPVQDLDRATGFYEEVLGIELRREVFGGVPHAIFVVPKPGVGGALIADAKRKPAREGTVVYLGTESLDRVIDRVARAGGRVLMPKTDIGAPGFIAMMEDSEGNVVGLSQRH